MALDRTWQVGIGWGLVITVLTVAGVVLAKGATGLHAAMGLGVLGWLGFLGWLEKGVAK
jgi:hypothetical protein